MTAPELIATAEALEGLAARAIAWFRPEPGLEAFEPARKQRAEITARQLEARAALLRSYAASPDLASLRAWILAVTVLVHPWLTGYGGLQALVGLEAGVLVGTLARLLGLAPWAWAELEDDPPRPGRALWAVEVYDTYSRDAYRLFGRWRTTGEGAFARAITGLRGYPWEVVQAHPVCEQCGSIGPNSLSRCVGCGREHAELELKGHRTECPRNLALADWHEAHYTCGSRLPLLGLREAVALELADEAGRLTAAGEERCRRAAQVRGLMDPSTGDPNVTGARLLALACDDERAARKAAGRRAAGEGS